MVNRKKVEEAIKMLLDGIGEDSSREGLVETPSRVARMYEELLAGYDEDPKVHLSKVFSTPSGELVLEKDIFFSSTCEHHLMPFFGKASIAYIPNGKVVGLSKLARTVDVYAKRLQLQERLTEQICDAVYKNLNAKAVMVVTEAEHTCMTCRGIKRMNTKVTSYAVRGEIDNDLKYSILQMLEK